MKYKMLSIFVANLLFCSSCYSLTLGNIEISSAFREPLKAQIPVLNIDTADSGSIKAMLAEDYAFLKARINRQAVLDSLDLSLNMNDSGNYFISLSSDEPINELFLELILDIGTDKERFSREYTSG